VETGREKCYRSRRAQRNGPGACLRQEAAREADVDTDPCALRKKMP